MLDRPITYKFNQNYDNDSFEQQRINDFIESYNKLFLSHKITVTKDENEPGGTRYETPLYYLDFQITEDGEFTVQLDWKGEKQNE